ncbi:bifunctional riboflavin kinase/FAD synthetase [Aliagarivorans marinus]|uniref:bifunctional riboflavin kinase/FAD synthetase n=1 Tax=Aliagarivorans marinus TaxID=561965 RepID=UPI000401FD87|nr:bifunctional riboflavin kinase/FAD synthetase [Aliagarivorans marinus]
MELIRGIHNIRQQHHGCALTIGNFDGVHLGHQHVLEKLLEQARLRKLPATVMVFEPQPLEVFAKQQAPARLTRFREKYQALKALGVDRMLCVNFNPQFAEQTADYFIEDLLVKGLGVEYLAVGDDFRFGRGRSGDFAALQQAGERFGFTVTNSHSFCVEQRRVSSTAIRELLAHGHFEDAKQMLGRAFHFSGRVVHGQKLGRQLGFATANLRLDRKVPPLTGVYAVNAELPDGRTFPGVANVGKRPTAGGEQLLLETHLFGFSENLYGQFLRVEPQLKLRDEVKFPSLEALKAQVELDIKQAKSFYDLAE